MSVLEPPTQEARQEIRDVESFDLETLSATFKALADPARLKILHHLAFQSDEECCGSDRGVCACDFETLTGLSQPTVSHHMKALVNANLVIGEKRGKWMHYRINSNGFDYVKEVLAQIGC